MKRITARGSAKAEYATIDCNKIDRLRNRAKKRLASDLRENRKARRSGYARRELWDRARHDDNRSYRRRYDDDADDNRDDRDRGRRGRQFGREGRDNKKKGNRVASGERGMRREGDERQATTSKKPWARHDERRREERVGRDDREQRLRDKAHAIDHRWTSSDDGSRDDDKKTVASEEEKSEDDDEHDNFAVAMSPPAKKAKKSHRVVSKETRKRRASGERPTREVQGASNESRASRITRARTIRRVLIISSWRRRSPSTSRRTRRLQTSIGTRRPRRSQQSTEPRRPRWWRRTRYATRRRRSPRDVDKKVVVEE